MSGPGSHTHHLGESKCHRGLPLQIGAFYEVLTGDLTGKVVKLRGGPLKKNNGEFYIQVEYERQIHYLEEFANR